MPNTCGTGGWTGPLPGDPSNNSILSAVSAFGGIELHWTYPSTNPFAVAHVLVFRSNTNNYSHAVQIALVNSNTYFDNVGPGVLYYYWIKFVSINGTYGSIIGPASAVARSSIEQTIIELSGKIETSALGVNLRTAIGNITSNYDELKGEIDDVVSRNTGLSTAILTLQNGVTQSLTYIGEEVIRRTNGNSALVSVTNSIAAANANNLALIQEEKIVRVTDDSALGIRIDNLIAELPDVAALISEERMVRVNAEGAIAVIADNAKVAVGNAAAAVTDIKTAKIGYSALVDTVSPYDSNEPYDGNGTTIVYPVATYPALTYPEYEVNRTRIIDKTGVTNWNAIPANSSKQLVWLKGLPLATAIKSVGISDGASYLTLEQRMTAQKKTNGDLEGQYSVKIDAGGRVAGFGFSNTSPTAGTGTSEFIINSDRFSVAKPLDYSQPFTPGTSVVGKTWFNTNDKKTYKRTATTWDLYTPIHPFIIDASTGETLIDNAVIRKLTATSIDTRGLSIRNASGTVILNAGESTFSGNVTGTVNNIAVADINNYLKLTNVPAATTVDLSSKLDKASTEILSVSASDATRVAGIRVGDITWANGARTGGTGLAITPTGILAHNGSIPTFGISLNGNAAFAGELLAASGTFSGSLTANAVNAVKTVNIGSNAATICQGASSDNNTAEVTFTLAYAAEVQLIGQAAHPTATTIGLYINNGLLNVTETVQGTAILVKKASLAAGTHTFRVTSGSGAVRASIVVFASIR